MPRVEQLVFSARFAVGPVTRLTPQDRDIMPEDQDLSVLSGVFARQQHKAGEHAAHELARDSDHRRATRYYSIYGITAGSCACWRARRLMQEARRLAKLAERGQLPAPDL